MASEHFPTIGTAALDVDDAERFNPGEQIESLCMQCHEQGMTRMLLTYIPYFKEVIVVSFRCDHCGASSHSLFFGDVH